MTDQFISGRVDAGSRLGAAGERGRRPTRRHALAMLAAAGLSHPPVQAQSPAPTDPLFAVKTAEAVLAALTPAITVDKLESGNELLLDVPDVVRSGEVIVRMTSVMPQTQRMWLLTLQPDALATGALLAQFKFGPHEPPEARATVKLDATQTLLLVAQARGRYFGVRREVKVGFDIDDARSK
ncbi:hypothetical protein QTI33_14485 [Variovorax sp. J22P271]|uniref:hypothetical protein n=1 Tax=Variovorax davisae TaxID=3053515 RepID=UPI002578C638|nr:hypothetical protein [Variovorax sp. J22P271]MDM0033339.1 hypothetical protein [Variovorax sp. J22P271]